MQYSIIVTADWHWGAMNPYKQYNEMLLLVDTINKMEHLDLLVIAGDIFDNRLSMDSNVALTAIKYMNLLYETCMKNSVKMRVVLGTESHDNNQLGVFEYFDDGDKFKIITENTLENTFDDLQCLYAPDENISTKDYLIKYKHNIETDTVTDIMFFHGTFDAIAPDIMLTNAEKMDLQNVIFPADVFKKYCKLIVGGHWHDGEEYDNIYYTRSFSRWCFNENNSKGFIHIIYNTDDKEYKINRIENDITDTFDTYIIDTSIYNNIQMYNDLIFDIEKRVSINTGDSKDKTHHIRIKFLITNTSSDNDTFLNMLKYRFSNNKHVKIVVKNSLQAKKRVDKKHELSIFSSKNSYITDSKLSIYEKIHKFILETKNEEVPLDVIENIVGPYVNK